MNSNKLHQAGVFLLASLLTVLGVLPSSAEEERVRLLKCAAELRGAMIIVERDGQWACGCFIEKEGLAVFPLSALSTPNGSLKFSLTTGDELQPPVIRLIDSENGIAIVKFDRPAKTWIESRADPVQLHEQVAILDPERGGVEAIGPIISESKTIEVLYRRPIYQRYFSIAAGLPAGRDNPFVIGAPVIDSTGKLRGIFHKTRRIGSQTFLGAKSTAQWAAGIAKARTSELAIRPPLPPEQDPFDPAHSHPDYSKAMMFATQGNYQRATLHVEMALKAHPDSCRLHSLHCKLAASANVGDLVALAEKTKPPEGGSKAEQVIYYEHLADALRSTGDKAGAERAIRKGIELVPDEANLHRFYSGWLEEDQRFEEALSHCQKACMASPDNIALLEAQGRLLRHLRKWGDEKEVSGRIDKLYSLYRSTTSRDLQLKK